MQEDIGALCERIKALEKKVNDQQLVIQYVDFYVPKLLRDIRKLQEDAVMCVK